MFEELINQIDVLKSLYSFLEKLEVGVMDQEDFLDVDGLLRNNVYVKDLTFKYFGEKEDITGQIEKTFILISELKKYHIKVSDKQKECEAKYKRYICETKLLVTKIIELLEKIRDKKIYINSEIADILKLDIVKEISNIIEYNKMVNLKKMGLLNEKKEPDKVEKKECKVAPQVPVQTVLSKPVPEVVSVDFKRELKYADTKCLNDYLQDKYAINISSDNSIEDLNDMIEIIENEPFGFMDDTSFIKELLEKSNIQILLAVRELLKGTDFNVWDIKHMRGLFFDEEHEKLFNIISLILSDPFLDRDGKIKMFNKRPEQQEVYFNNSVIIYAYNITQVPTRYISVPLSMSTFDRLIECGHYEDLRAIEKCYIQDKDVVKHMQLENYINNTRLPNLYYYFFGLLLSETCIVNELMYQSSMSMFNKKIMAKIMSDKKYKKKNVLINDFDIRLLTSNKQILKAEEVTDKKSQKNLYDTLVPFWNKKGNPFYKEKNIYLNFLEEKYTNSEIFEYMIPVRKDLCKLGFIIISKNKVIRLINQHILDGDEITPDLIKQCMFYNLIITDDVLKELDTILTRDFNKLEEKSKRLKKV